MRLTLRTLLAYLDNTLDPQDAEALRNKLAESGFATQLVQRIRGTLANGSLPAPSPEAVGPVEEANVISEYLDSTLPSEQVAEIERACLESDPHLGEAAACHQILTMILGKPAEVSPELRQRIYELPDRRVEDIAAFGSFSGVAIPSDGPQPLAMADEIPTADMTSGREVQPVQPVGASDSGVSDAPTRLRQAEATEASQGRAESAMAGSKRRSIGETSLGFGGAIRPSRIAPWLVSLGLAGVLLFALTRIFQPLLSPKSVSLDLGNGATGEISVPAEEAPVMVDVEGQDEADSSASDSITADATETLPAPSVTSTPETTLTDSESAPSVENPQAGGGTSAQAAATPAAENGSEESVPAPSAPPAVAASSAEMPANASQRGNATQPANASQPQSPEMEVSDTPDAPTTPDALDSTDASAAEAPEGATPVAAPTAAKADAPVPPPASKVVDPAKKVIAKIVSDESLMAGRLGEKWVRLKNEMEVGQDIVILCAPTFRGRMRAEGAAVAMVGPAQVQWLASEENIPTLHLEYGRILISATEADAALNVQLGGDRIKISFADAGTVVAASVKHFRAPGFDPLKPENRVPVTGVLAVQGSLTMTVGGKEVLLDTHQRWIQQGTADADVSAVPMESLPDWIDPPDSAKSTLESSARSGLMELLKGERPIEIALREAALFRRTEVAALAAQTLAALGQGDIYFGGDGILSSPKHRAYWPDHFNTLLAVVDRSAASAQQLRDSIERMDSANAKPLFRLLTGYSQKQLVEGGDEELVELLDSSSMSVRVLALENLQRITGTTLYFRAEQENAVRRAPMIKKWVARLRKGDIRWQE